MLAYKYSCWKSSSWGKLEPLQPGRWSCFFVLEVTCSPELTWHPSITYSDVEPVIPGSIQGEDGHEAQVHQQGSPGLISSLSLRCPGPVSW